jgi:hypothetical protein
VSTIAHARLRDQLTDLEVEHATLRAELIAFEADYLRVLGIPLAELHELEARILALVAVRSGTPDDERAAEAARERARETTTAIRSIPTPAGPPPTDDLKTLFRDAAKRMHPDLVPDDARTHAEAFMKRLNQAYGAGEADAIRNLIRQWEASPFGAADAESAERTLQVAVAEAQRRLDEARGSELAQLMERSLRAAVEGRDLLAEMKVEIEAALVAARARLAALEGER